MAEQEEYLRIPGHVSAKEAAVMLNGNEDQIWYYIRSGSLPARKVSGRYMIPLEAIKSFRIKSRGRRRTDPTSWRAYRGGARVYGLQIEVQARSPQREELQTRLQALLLEEQKYRFPGTMLRQIFADADHPHTILIELIWKDTELTDEAGLQRELEAFKAAFADVLDWETARYRRLQALIHT